MLKIKYLEVGIGCFIFICQVLVTLMVVSCCLVNVY